MKKRNITIKNRLSLGNSAQYDLRSNTPQRYRSPYIEAKVRQQSFTPKLTKENKNYSLDNTISQNECNQQYSLTYLCKICKSIDQIEEKLEAVENWQIIEDEKFSIYCIQLLEVLASELSQQSKTYFFQLFNQVKYIIFDKEITYFSRLNEIKRRMRKFDKKYNKGQDNLQDVYNRNKDLKQQLQEQVQKRQKLQLDLEQLKLNKKQNEQQIQILGQQMKEFQIKYLQSYTLQQQIASQIETAQQCAQLSFQKLEAQKFNFHSRIVEIKQNYQQQFDENFQPFKDQIEYLEKQISDLQNELQKQQRLHSTQKLQWKNTVIKTKQSYQKQIDELNQKLQKALNRFKLSDFANQQCIQISQKIKTNAIDITYEQMINLFLTTINTMYGIIEQYVAQINKLQDTITVLDISRQNILDRLDKLKLRVDMNSLYEQDLSLKFKQDGQYFQALGKGLDIPRYLRTAVPVPKINVSKQEVLEHINLIWQQKQRWEGKLNKETPITNIFYNYLRTRFNYNEKVLLYGYNIIDSAQRFSNDPDCDMFISILQDQLPQELYFDCQRMVRGLRKTLLQIAITRQNMNEGLHVLDQLTVLKVVRTCFPNRTQQDIDALQILLSQDANYLHCDLNSIPVERLFATQNDCLTGKFVAGLKKHLIIDVNKTYKLISDKLLKKVKEDDTVKCKYILKAIKSLDKFWSNEDIIKIMKPILGSQLNFKDSQISLQVFLDKLKLYYIKLPSFYQFKQSRDLV